MLLINSDFLNHLVYKRSIQILLELLAENGIRDQPMERQVCRVMPSCVLFWHYGCLRQVTLEIAFIGLLVAIFQVLCVKFCIEKGLS